MMRCVLPVACLVIAPLSALAGPITPPPGPVTSTHKTLTEVEPRIAVNAVNTPGDASATYRITQPGSYYLTGNITGEANKNGIVIASVGVTLDLNGFTLSGVPDSLDGIRMNAYFRDVVIRNGHVRSWGKNGLGTRIDSGRIENVTVSENKAWGIENEVGSFTAHIVSCVASANGTNGSGGGFRVGTSALITDCIARNNSGVGIHVESGSIVERCVAHRNSTDGIVAVLATVMNCNATYNYRHGIVANAGSLILSNLCISNGVESDGANIHATGNQSTIEDNRCAWGKRGIQVTGASNVIKRNICTGGTTANWSIAANNSVAPIVLTTKNASAITGNTYTGSLGSTDPNANFTH